MYRRLYPRQRKAALRVRAILVNLFPATFFPQGSLKKPLKLGIADDLVALRPGLAGEPIQITLSDYCSGPSYLIACQAGASRLDLAGEPCGTVSEAHATAAQNYLSSFPYEIQNRWKGELAKMPSGYPGCLPIEVSEAGEGVGALVDLPIGTAIYP